jgi:ParB-like chromosome segregation protein Spo0J
METKVWTKQEYVELIPPVSTQDFERLKASIKEHNGLLMPIVLNQDHVVLDGHHRMRACKELGIPISFTTRNYKDKPLEELKFVVHTNLVRRHLDEFQKAEIGIKMEKIVRQIYLQHKSFTKETAAKAARKRWHPEEVKAIGKREGEREEEEDADMPIASADAIGIDNDDEEGEPPTRSSQEIGNDVGVSASTIDRVKTILEQGSQEQIAALKQKSQTGSGPGVRTVYEQVQQEKLKTKLASEAEAAKKVQVKQQKNVKLFNKDFRTIVQSEVANDSVDLVITLEFPEASRSEDAPGRLHEQLMNNAALWLKEGGLLAMPVDQEHLPRVICQKPPMLQFCHIICHQDGSQFYRASKESPTTFQTEWRPICIFVKGLRDAKPSTPQTPAHDLIGGPYEQYETNEQEFLTDTLRILSAAGSVVLDPFMGKGGIGHACLKLERTYIGIESDSTQFLTAMHSLHEAS